MSKILININEDIQTIEQSYEEFLNDFKSDPSIMILGKNCLSLLNEYAQLNGQLLAFQVISQSGQSHQPM
jgi:hypothetical protein